MTAPSKHAAFHGHGLSFLDNAKNALLRNLWLALFLHPSPCSDRNQPPVHSQTGGWVCWCITSIAHRGHSLGT